MFTESDCGLKHVDAADEDLNKWSAVVVSMIIYSFNKGAKAREVYLVSAQRVDPC